MRRGRLLSQGTAPKARLRASRAQESAVAKDLGGRVQVASGSRDHLKGDVVLPEHLIECKRTDHKSYPLKLDEFRKVTLEAIMANRRAVMSIEIQKTKLAVIPWEDYLALVERDQNAVPSAGSKAAAASKSKKQK